MFSFSIVHPRCKTRATLAKIFPSRNIAFPGLHSLSSLHLSLQITLFRQILLLLILRENVFPVHYSPQRLTSCVHCRQEFATKTKCLHQGSYFQRDKWSSFLQDETFRRLFFSEVVDTSFKRIKMATGNSCDVVISLIGLRSSAGVLLPEIHLDKWSKWW